MLPYHNLAAQTTSYFLLCRHECMLRLIRDSESGGTILSEEALYAESGPE